METKYRSAFRSELQFSDVVEGHIWGPAFDAKMHSTHWLNRGQGVFESPVFFIQMFLNASTEMKGTYVNNPHPSDYAALGSVSFVPEHSPLLCSWTRGEQRTISCMFDMEILSQRLAVDWNWSSFDPSRTLSIQNEYVRVGLRRISEEVLSPGFASSVQVECSLMFIGLALQRHFESGTLNLRGRNGSLTERQLDLMRSMIVDTAGAPPTIAMLASACGMNGRQLALYYRQTTGTTLRSFIARGRVERAKMLLLDGQTRIKQIASDSGFQNPSAFAAAFRKSVGMSPIDFRARMSRRRSD